MRHYLGVLTLIALPILIVIGLARLHAQEPTPPPILPFCTTTPAASNSWCFTPDLLRTIAYIPHDYQLVLPAGLVNVPAKEWDRLRDYAARNVNLMIPEGGKNVEGGPTQ